MNRRTLLKLMALQAAVLPSFLESKEYKKENKHLILIELKGGNDGLNTLIPFRDPLYYHLRPTISVEKKMVLQLDGEQGLHPSMQGMREIYEDGELAIIQGVGYPHPNRSHFRSIEIWDTASKANEYLDKGWLGTLKSIPFSKLQGLVLGGEYGPLSDIGKGIVRIKNLHTFLNQSNQLQAKIYMTGENHALLHLLKTETTIRESADILKKYSKKGKNFTFPFEKSHFGRQMEMTGRLIRNNIELPFFKVSLESFDTHFNQPKRHSKLLEQLSNGISTLRKNLIESGQWENCIIMTYSEFGRRVQENASRGTDHGTAAPHFILGGKVHGGLYGKTPLLSKLDKNGDLIYTSDFRSVYHTVSKGLFHSSSPLIKDFPTFPLFR